VADLAGIYACLQGGDPGGALVAIDAIDARTLAPGDRARLHAWRGQALRDLGRPEEGAREVIHAIRITKVEGDHDSVARLRELHAEISRSVVALRTAADAAREARASLREPLPDDPELLLQRAAALLDAPAPGPGTFTGEERPDPEAAALLERAEALAREPRHGVLAALLRARFSRDVTALFAAHALADEAGDPALIAAVARTAKLLGVALRPPTFG
jgi:hypothetical protein